MNDLEKEFVPYEQAIELRRLGFEDEYLAWWNFGEFRMFGWDLLLDSYAGEIDERPIAPTFAQAFRWFRKKHKLHSYIDGAYPWFRFHINSDDNKWEGFKHLEHEEAELECLKKLIEIVKNK